MSETEYINPLNDFFIRYLFASPGNETLCLAFINAVLEDADFPRVAKVAIKNPFNLKTEIASKESITDIKAETEDGGFIDIEVQTGDKGNYVKRSLYYGSKILVSGLAKGEDYQDLKPVVVISLLDFVLWNNVEKPHSCFMLIDKADGESILTTDFVFHYIEAPKLKKYYDKLGHQLRSWLKYFQIEGSSEEEMRVLIQNEPAIGEAHQLYKKFTGSQEYREAYEVRKKWERDQLSALNHARKQGLEQGLEQTAENMKKMGFSTEQIIKATGLSVEKVEKLRPE